MAVFIRQVQAITHIRGQGLCNKEIPQFKNKRCQNSLNPKV